MTDHPVKKMMRLMAARIITIANEISDEEIEALISEILNANRVYTMGAGRSGLVAKAFAMRLMHLGFTAYVVGETVTPAMKPGDLIIVFSGSGATRTIADIAETAKGIGGRLCLITSKRDSRIARIADCVVIIESQRDKVADESAEFEIRQMMGEHRSFAPLGTIFETTAMIFADAIISRLMEIMSCRPEDLQCRHANIE